MRRLMTLALVLTPLVLGASIPPPATAADTAATQQAATNPKQVSSKIDVYLKGLASENHFSGAVLVARKGKVLLAKGYGMAVRESAVPNSSTTKYPLPGTSFTLSLAAGLRLEDQGRLVDTALVCAYLPSCPDTWKAMTVGMVLDGTAGLGDAGWGKAGHTTAQSLAHCQAEPLATASATRPTYANCAVVVLGLIFEKLSGQPWEDFMRHEIFGPAAMKNSGLMTDSLLPPARAQDYSGSTSDPDVVYNDYFQVYGTIRDAYSYDTALFGGKLLSQTSLRRMLAPRGAATPPDAYISHEQQAAKWKVGQLFGRQVIVTADDTKSFTGANMRFPRDGVTVIAISNDDQNDVEDVAVHAAALVFGKTVVAPPPTPTPTVDPAKAVLATINVGRSLAGPAATTDAIWAGNPDAGTVTRIDIRTNTVAATIKLSDPTLCGGCAQPLALATAGDQVWVGDIPTKSLVRIDPSTNAVVQTIPIGIRATDLAFGAGSLWAIDQAADQLVRVDPIAGKVVAVVNNLPSPAQVAAGDDTVWVSTYGDSMVHRIDPATNTITASIHVDGSPESLAVDNGALWVSTNRPQNLVRIDAATNTVVATIPLSGGTFSDMQGPCCRAVAVGEGAVWAIAHSINSLDRIDPQTNKVTATLALPVPSGVGKIATWDVVVGAGSIWVNADPGILYRVDPKAMVAP